MSLSRKFVNSPTPQLQADESFVIAVETSTRMSVRTTSTFTRMRIVDLLVN